MPRLRRLTSREVLRVFVGFGCEVVGTLGSHAKLVRALPSGERHILTVPVHRQLSIRTVHAIYRQASRFIPEADLRQHFFTD